MIDTKKPGSPGFFVRTETGAATQAPSFGILTALSSKYASLGNSLCKKFHRALHIF